MFNQINSWVLFLAGILLTGGAAAASLRSVPSPILISDARGQCYVKSVPPDSLGQGGGTRVYRIGIEKDQLLHSYGWYSPGLAIKCGSFGPRGKLSFSLVRMGRGWMSELSKTPRAVTLAFYLGGKALAEYSRIDIALLPRNRRIGDAGSWMGYWRPLGYKRFGSRDGFEICTIDGRMLVFDFTNGDFVDHRRYPADRCERFTFKYSPNFQKIVTTYY